MSEEDKETGSEKVKPLPVGPIKGLKGTKPITAIRAEEKKDQE
jgi:hypothetical protein